MFTFLLVLFIIVVLLLVPVILLQSGSGAQSGMFGSDLAMGAFGAKTNEVLVNFTKILVGLFLILAFAMSWLKIQESKALTRANRPANVATQPEAPAAPAEDTNAAAPVEGGINPSNNALPPLQQ